MIGFSRVSLRKNLRTKQTKFVHVVSSAMESIEAWLGEEVMTTDYLQQTMKKTVCIFSSPI